MKRIVSACLAAWMLPGCNSPASKPDFGEAKLAEARAYADKSGSPARGELYCYVKQDHSAAKYAKLNAMNFGVPLSYLSTSDVKFRVDRSGRVSVVLVKDVYPLTTIYFLVNGKRYSANERDTLYLPAAAVAAISAGATFHTSWTTWPYNSIGNDEDAYVGFAEALADCRAYLAGAAG